MEPAINEGVSADVAAPASSSTSPQAPRPTIHRSMSQFLQKTMTPAKQKTVDEELAKMIAEDFQPFSIVEDRGFRSYTHALNPMYVLPSRKTLSKKIILQLYYEKHVLLLERVKKKTPLPFVSTTAGHSELPHPTCQLHATLLKSSRWCPVCWIVFSSVKNTHLRHICHSEQKSCSEWQKSGMWKIRCCVSDNAANITKAIKI